MSEIKDTALSGREKIIYTLFGVLVMIAGFQWSELLRRVERSESKIEVLELQNQKHTDEEGHHAFTINEHTKAIQLLERTKQDKRKPPDE